MANYVLFSFPETGTRLILHGQENKPQFGILLVSDIPTNWLFSLGNPQYWYTCGEEETMNLETCSCEE